MRNKKVHVIVITLLTISSIFIGLGWISVNNFSGDFKENVYIGTPHTALNSITINDISLNETEIFRLFETVNITVDAHDFPNVNYTEIQIPYLNNTYRNINMSWIKDEIFSYSYTPGSYSPHVLQEIRFQVFDTSQQLLNGDVEDASITVLPNCLVTFHNSTRYLNDELHATITPSSVSNETFSWNKWNVSIVDNEYQDLFHIDGDNINSFSFTINDSFSPLNDYYARVNLYNNYQERGVEYYKFSILNHAPEIIENTISFTSNSIFRTESCTITLNASDVEDALTPGFLNVSITVKTPDDQTIRYQNNQITNNGDGSFTDTFPTYYYYEIGVYTVEIKVKDRYDVWSTVSYATFTLKNNPPILGGYSINGYPTSQSISVLYGQNLVFSFNVSDVEGIAYVRVALIDENNQWYNITQPYEVDVEITLRTTQLITGVWYLYIFVIDNDGSITGLGSDYNAAPQAIRIIPDVLSALLPWIALIIGLIIGVIAGVGAGYYRIKSKLGDSQGVKVKKKAPASKKPIPKKKPQAKPESIDDETKDKPKVYEKKESEEKAPQRKIKRKL
jgi:hypothetical protein